eukprot:8501271-Pyramimonas_sp.AAC.1
MKYETVQDHLQSVAARMSFNHNSARTVFYNNGSDVFTPRETYMGKGHSVRGIHSEMWAHEFTIPDWVNPNGVNKYTVEHYFAAEDWRTASNTVHRMLKRIVLNGTHWDGKKVRHTYEYIDMTPFIYDPDRVFNPCTVLDFDFLGNCSCNARELRMLVTDLGNMQMHKVNHHYSIKDVCSFYGIHLNNEQKGEVAGTAIALWFVGVFMGIGCMHLRKTNAARRQQRHMQ